MKGVDGNAGDDGGEDEILDEDLIDDALEDALEEFALPGGTAERPLSIRGINAMLQQLLAATLPPVMYIQGEISNFRTYDRGHAFFTLKEPGAELPCVIWKDALARLKFKPKDGMTVIARGNVKLYEPQGKLQLYVETLLPLGAGALELAFRQLCVKLREEGLFEASRKRPIPRLPQRVVIVTSRTGDVLHDVLTTAYRRYPGLHTMLYAVRVQGEQAVAEIVRAIQKINRHQEKLQADLILLVRGGGSLEDLWAFNEEAVARAIVASRIPIATGIGHEPDTTIADLVGDLRGATPTGVTELTIPDVRAIGGEIEGMRNLLTRDMGRMVELAGAEGKALAGAMTQGIREALRRRMVRLEQLTRNVERIEPRHAIAQGWRRVEEAQRNLGEVVGAARRAGSERLSGAGRRLERASPGRRLPQLHDRVKRLEEMLGAAVGGRMSGVGLRVGSLAEQLRMVSPQAVLERGYSITTDQGGKIIRSAADVVTGDILRTRVADGTIESTVGKLKQQRLF